MNQHVRHHPDDNGHKQFKRLIEQQHETARRDLLFVIIASLLTLLIFLALLAVLMVRP